MGFLGLRKAAWKHRDPQVRLAAVQELEYDQQGTFAELARGDVDARVRLAAAHRVTDQSRLEALLGATDPEVARVAKERLAGVAVKLVRERPLAACRAVFDTISEQKSLAELSLGAADAAVRAAAFAKLTAAPEPSPAMLALIAVQDAGGEMGKRAVALIAKRSLLKDIARKAKHTAVQSAAQARADALEAENAKPSAEQSRKARQRALEPLVAVAVRLALAGEWEKAEAEWRELDARRRQVLDEFSGIALDESASALDERFQRARREFDQRRAADEAKRQEIIAERERLLMALTAEGPGEPGEAARERRHALQAQWSALGALPSAQSSDFDRRFKELLDHLCPLSAPRLALDSSGSEALLDDAQRAELEQLSADSELLVESTDWRGAQDKFHLLHKRWSQISAPLPLNHSLRNRFVDAYAKFKERRRAARDERNASHRERLLQLENLALAAEALAAMPPSDGQLREHFNRIRQLQTQWKAVGALRLDLIKSVRERFRTACDAAFVPVRALQEADDWERFAHFAKAEELITQVEALQTNEDFAMVAKGIKQAQANWKQLGPLPRDKREPAWQRFRAACDLQFERCKGYFAELDAQRAANLAKKQQLVSEAEQLAQQGPVGLAGSPADLAAKRLVMERVKGIQQEWRTVGPVPREHDQEIWTRFRAACDRFFAHHRADLDARHQEQIANLNLKLALCVSAEDLAKEAEQVAEAVAAQAGGRFQHARLAEPEERLRAIKAIQLNWKNIGHVPRDQAEPLWTRFRAACDRVYATAKDHLDGLERQRQENLAKKLAVIAEVEEILKHENPRWFRDDLKQLQRQWREIGHVPRDHMDELAQRFQALNERIQAL